MYNHEPDGYDCPFCRLVGGLDTFVSRQDDVVYRDDVVTTFMSASTWPNNLGHVLVVPNAHYENVYDLHRSSRPRSSGSRVLSPSPSRRSTGATASRRGSTTSRRACRTCGTTTSTCSPGTRATTCTCTARGSSTSEERHPYATKLRGSSPVRARRGRARRPPRAAVIAQPEQPGAMFPKPRQSRAKPRPRACASCGTTVGSDRRGAAAGNCST